jgi:hypothetical protein
MRSAGRKRVRFARSHWVATSKYSHMRRFAYSQPASTGTWVMYAYSFLPSAGRTLELYILVGINLLGSGVDDRTLLCFFCKPSIAPQWRAKLEAM